MPASPFRIDITDLVRGSTQVRPERITSNVAWSVAGTTVLEGQPITANLTLARISGGVVVFGMVDATVRSTCDRCLKVYEAEISVKVQASLLFDVDDDDEDAYLISSSKIDLEPILRDEVLLDLPLRSLCVSDCAGLVEYVQSDLNTGVHEAEKPSSPFGVLRDLLQARE